MTATARFCTLSIAAAALIALPLAAGAQTYPTTGSGQSTSGQANPSSQYGSTDQNSPGFHLDEAKKVLDQISTTDLTGSAMTQIAQIKTQFSNLYNDYQNKSGSAGTSGTTTPPPTSASGSAMGMDWKSQFNKIESELDQLNVPKSSFAPPSRGSTAGMSGTTGTAGAATGAANVTLPQEVQDKLTEFRAHLEQFYSLTQR